MRKALLDRGYQLLTLVWSTLNLEVGMKKLSRYIQVKVIICLQKLTHSSYDHIYSGVVVLQYSSILGVFWPVKYELEFFSFVSQMIPQLSNRGGKTLILSLL